MADPIEKVRDRITELYYQVTTGQETASETLVKAFDSVSDVIEEAERFYEELTVRNEELITARQALEDERRRYQELFEFAPDAYLVTDAHGVVTEANRAAARMLSIRQDHLVGKPLRLFVASEGRPLFSRLLLEQKGASQVEIPLDPRVGPRITTEVTMMVVPGMGGKPSALRWMLRDVSEREKEHQALAASENRFRTIFEDAHLGMQLVGLDGKVIECNRAFLEMTGYASTYILGREADALIHADDQVRFKRLLKELSEGNTDYIRLEVRYPTISGDVVWARVSISLLRDMHHVPRNTIHMIENISQEKQSAAEVVEMKRKMLEGIEAERLRLAQDLHDGPMQDLYAAVFKLSMDDSLAEGSAPTASSENIVETQQMLKQVASTLRTICGELRPPTLLNLGLERAIRSHMERTMSSYPDVAVHLNLMEDSRLTAEHRLSLFRIYQQAIANVMRHSKAKEINIRLKFEPAHVMLEVEDDGQGFELPERMVELTRGGHYGLAGIAERVEALGGKMEVLTAPGEGTHLRVKVPI